MRCKKHFTDLSSSVGVCASCLRERLFVLIAAQAQAQAQLNNQTLVHGQDDHRKSDANQPPLHFPRSVSPYINRRKSDNAVPWTHHHHSLSDRRFYSTPQVGPNASLYKKKHSKFFLSNLFRSKTQKFDSDTNSRELCSTTSASSQSWFSNIFGSGRRRKQARNSTRVAGGIPCQNRGRGMSPARVSGVGADEECRDGSSGYSSDSSQGCKETPRRAAQRARRAWERSSNGRNISGLAFCLSPLVRPSPNQNWNQKVMTTEISVSGEIRVPGKPHISVASSFHANRSRKLADFGRFNPNR